MEFVESDTETVVDVGTDRQLFLDDDIVDRRRDVRMETHRPVRRGTVLTFDRPWEGPLSYYPVVIRDEDRYRMWYRAKGDDHSFVAYAESADGIDWHRPSVGSIEFEGSRDNNIVSDRGIMENAGVFLDGNPEAPPEERYKALGRAWYEDEPSELWGLSSPDGRDWETVADEPLIVAPDDDPYFDSQIGAFWDDERRRYVVYLRGQFPDGGDRRVRAIRIATSDNFLDWEPLEYISIENDPLWREHLYTNAAQQYYRAPVYLQFPMRFVPDRRYDEDWPEHGQSDVLLLASRDGKHWVRPYDGAFLRPGRDEDNWHDRAIFAGQNVVPTGGGEMSLYAVQNYRTKNVRVDRFTLREDGFVSAFVGRSRGELVTKPLQFSGGELELNYSTSGAGSIRVGFVDSHGNPIAGFSVNQCEELFGDEIDGAVRWERQSGSLNERGLASNTDVSPLAGVPVRLRFVLREADLFSFRFRPL